MDSTGNFKADSLTKRALFFTDKQQTKVIYQYTTGRACIGYPDLAIVVCAKENLRKAYENNQFRQYKQHLEALCATKISPILEQGCLVGLSVLADQNTLEV